MGWGHGALEASTACGSCWGMQSIPSATESKITGSLSQGREGAKRFGLTKLQFNKPQADPSTPISAVIALKLLFSPCPFRSGLEGCREATERSAVGTPGPAAPSSSSPVERHSRDTTCSGWRSQLASTALGVFLEPSCLLLWWLAKHVLGKANRNHSERSP